MKISASRTLPFLFLLLFSCFPAFLPAQMITGAWQGRINRQKVEVKIIQKGDSLTGTAYYYESAGNYRRYTIKGYFDAKTNEAVWWDDQLIVAKSGRLSISLPGKTPMLSTADFNCPGGGKMMLDGKTASRDDENDKKGDVHLDKIIRPAFEDEWDFVIENYTVGANDPEIIDSVGSVALVPINSTAEGEKEPEQTTVLIVPPPREPQKTPEKKPLKKEEPAPQPVKTIPVEPLAPTPVKMPSIEEKFAARKKQFIKEIPLTGDTLELRFYDNAEIDGDSISLFLNDQLLAKNIRLTGNPHTIRIPLSSMKEQNELVMVAENLGTIPPNTSYMIAMVNGIRYDAYLASTEGSSAMIRFSKPPH